MQFRPFRAGDLWGIFPQGVALGYQLFQSIRSIQSVRRDALVWHALIGNPRWACERSHRSIYGARACHTATAESTRTAVRGTFCQSQKPALHNFCAFEAQFAAQRAILGQDFSKLSC